MPTTPQEAWVRLQRTDRASIDNLEAWLMTTVGRIGLNLLRSRLDPPRDALDQIAESNDPLHQPDPAIDVLLAETVGSALQIVIDMTPAERVAYLLHDAFGFPIPRSAGAQSDAGGRPGTRQSWPWTHSAH